MKIQACYSNIYFSGKVKYDLLPKNTILDMIIHGYTHNQIAQAFNVPKHVVTRSVSTYKINTAKIKNGERRVNTINKGLIKNK